MYWRPNNELEFQSGIFVSGDIFSPLTSYSTLPPSLCMYRITVNAIGPTPVPPDLIRGVSKDKMDALLKRQAINSALRKILQM